MSQSQVGLNNRGSQADYVLGTAEGWDAFGVVRWHAIEDIGRPYQYEITLQRQTTDGAVDLDTLLDAFATFRIASQTRGAPSTECLRASGSSYGSSTRKK